MAGAQFEPGQISGSQAVYLICMAIIGTATLVIPNEVIKGAGADAWLSGLALIPASLLMGYLWVWLAARWPGRDLFQLPVAAAGRLAGTALSLLLVVWVMLVTGSAVWIGVDPVITIFLPHTPRVVLVASVVFLAALAAHGQLEVVARLNQIVFWLVLVGLIAMVPLSVGDADLRRLLPVLGEGIRPVLKGMIGIAFLVENLSLVAVLPLISGTRRAGRLLLTVTALAGGILTLLMTWTVVIFGPSLPARFPYPVLMLAHVISIADILERLDSLMVAIWVAGVVAKVAFWYWLLCLGTARVLGLSDYRPLVWPMALLVSAVTMGYYRNPTELAPGLQARMALTIAVVGLGVPLLLLGLSALRPAGRRAGR